MVIGRGTQSFGVRASTILAGGSAVLPLPIPGVPRGSRPTEVVLHYDRGRKVAVRRGVFAYPTLRCDAGGLA